MLVIHRWWEQKGLELELARERAKDAEMEGTANDDMAAEITAPAAAAEAATTIAGVVRVSDRKSVVLH